MKIVKAIRPGGDKCLKSLTNIFNDILFKDKLPEEWMLSSVFKGKGDPLNANSYRGIKLLEHAFKLYEKVLEERLHEVVDIIKYNMDLCQEEGLLILCLFGGDLVKNSEPKIRSCFYIC